ncbi:MAG: UvrD-helicase domain-containing protein, partial [bacterium]|nr:UvrD-helicase domain-containing protein [bacterium]
MIRTEKLLQDLNPAQREAVWAPPGPLLIVAGAGSGKTRVLTHRIAYFIASNIAPHHILAITFTNKTADEMKSRVIQLLDNASSIPFVGTFHSLALRILREDAPALGIAKSFVIADEGDSLGILKRIMKRLKISPEELTPSEALNRISREKSELRGPDEMACKDEKEEIIRSLYEQYGQTLLNEGLLDFDDLLFYTVRLFQKHPDVLEKYRRRWGHVFVDEYQDTNTAQYTLVQLLAGAHRSITVVGDDYQAIYGWRNADYRNILNFQKDYPDAKVIKLEQNYRSTQTILDAADAVIKKVSARTEKTLIATRPAGAPVSITELSDQEEEAAFIIDEILAMRKKGVSLSDAVVLYRTNAQSRSLEEAFMRYGIPYKIVGGVKFYLRKEVKDLIAYLRVVHSPADSV